MRHGFEQRAWKLTALACHNSWASRLGSLDEAEMGSAGRRPSLRLPRWRDRYCPGRAARLGWVEGDAVADLVGSGGVAPGYAGQQGADHEALAGDIMLVLLSGGSRHINTRNEIATVCDHAIVTPAIAGSTGARHLNNSSQFPSTAISC